MKQYLHTLMGCLLLVAMTACEKDTMPEVFAPEVETGVATGIFRKGATLTGHIEPHGAGLTDRYGVLFSEYHSMAESQEIPVTSGDMEYSLLVKNLKPGETYYFCSFVHSGYSLVCGEVRSFTTTRSNPPIFDTPVISGNDEKSVTLSSEFLDDGGSELLVSGFCYNKVGEGMPTFIDHVTNMELTGNDMQGVIKGLVPSTTYQIRAYGASSKGVAYSGLVTVTTDETIVPFLSPVVCKDSTLYSIKVAASVIDKGSADVTETGFCYSVSNPLPDMNDGHIPMGKQTGEFSALIDNLAVGSTCYVRAYAVNEYGTGYSEVFTFSTVEPREPVLSDIQQTAASNFSVTVKTDIADEGAAPVTKSGFCWSSTNPMPTLEDNVKELNGQAMELTLENLEPGVTYYIRAYATNEIGTSYSEVFTFTAAEAKAPVLSATTQVESSDFSVKIEAQITDGGTASVTQSGFCWSTTNKQPTVEDSVKDLTSQLTDENWKISFSMTDLEPNTTYYIRSFAVNKFGTTYGEVYTFKTPYKDAENGEIDIEKLPTNNW